MDQRGFHVRIGMPGEKIQRRTALTDVLEKAIQKLKEELGKLGCLSADISQVGVLVVGIKATVRISSMMF